jgi:PAS domain S-box-containing protein
VIPVLSQIIIATLVLVLVYLGIGIARLIKLVERSDARCKGPRDPIGRLTEGVRRLKQSALENESRYKILTDNMAAAVVIHNPDGKVLWCSPYTEVLTGYSLSELYDSERGGFFTSHVHEDDRASIANALGIVATGESFQSRYRFYHRSGLCLWLETRTVPIFDPELNGYVALSITLDVTASVNAQLKLEERNRDLNELTYMLSHDLKAPIVTLRGMLEIVRESATKSSVEGDSNEPLEYMDKAVVRLEALVKGVLELAQVSTTERDSTPVSLAEVIGEVVDDFAWQFEQAGARIDVDAKLPWVFGNKTQLYQIFSNLVGNALKYRDESRSLSVSIKMSEATSRRRAVIVVSDNGRGISEHYLGSIFKPFARGGESKIEGSGVGLAAVKKLVEKLHGAIKVSSVVGEGSSFVIELRRAVDAERG